jgi:hypothetical protein
MSKNIKRLVVFLIVFFTLLLIALLTKLIDVNNWVFGILFTIVSTFGFWVILKGYAQIKDFEEFNNND